MARLLASAVAIAIALLLTPVSLATAQVSQNEAMQALSLQEHILLLERDRLLQLEGGLDAPIWVGSDFGSAYVFEAEEVMQQVETAILIVDLLGAEQAIIENLSPLQAAFVGLADRDQLLRLGKGYLRKLIDEESRRTRARILAGIDERIAHVRVMFEDVRSRRDATMAQGADGPPKSAKGDCPQRFAKTFSMVPKAGIPGHNREVIGPDAAIDSCLATCAERIWCKSVDYERGQGVCYLQPVNGCEMPLNRQYAGDPYDHYYRNEAE